MLKGHKGEGENGLSVPFPVTRKVTLPEKKKVARKKKSPQRTIAAGGDSKQWKAKLSFLKSKFLQKRRTGLTSQPEFSPGAENCP